MQIDSPIEIGIDIVKVNRQPILKKMMDHSHLKGVEDQLLPLNLWVTVMSEEHMQLTVPTQYERAGR